MIRPARASDTEAIARIYNHYIEHTVVTFEEKTVTAEEIGGRLATVESASYPWLVCERDGTVVGYAYANRWHARSAYRYTVESTVYLDHTATGQGLGTRLYEALLAILRGKQLHAAVGGISLPNAASVALHEKLGFSKVAHFKEVGFKFNRWVDVGYWQVVL